MPVPKILGPYCPDCGNVLDRAEDDTNFKEGSTLFKCKEESCRAKWEFDYGGIISDRGELKIKRIRN